MTRTHSVYWLTILPATLLALAGCTDASSCAIPNEGVLAEGEIAAGIDIRGIGRNVGAAYDSAFCSFEYEGDAFCNDAGLVVCSEGVFWELQCPDGSRCAAVDGVLDCYADIVTPPPITTPPPAATCPNVAGSYSIAGTSASCSVQPSIIDVTQSGCLIQITDRSDTSVLFGVNLDAQGRGIHRVDLGGGAAVEYHFDFEPDRVLLSGTSPGGPLCPAVGTRL